MSIKKNYMYDLSFKVLSLLIPLVTIPYLARTLGNEGIGIYSYTLSINQWFLLIASCGVQLYGQREIAYVRNDRDKLSKKFKEIFYSKVITTIISFLGYLVFVVVLSSDFKIFFILQGFLLLDNLIDIEWFYRGLEEFKKIFFRNIFLKIINVVLIFTLIKNSSDLWKYILIAVFTNILGKTLLWNGLSKYIENIPISKNGIKIAMKGSLKILLPQIAIQVYVVLDKTMLGYMKGVVELSYYDMAQKIVKILLMIGTSLGTVVAPRVSNLFFENKIVEVKKLLLKSFKMITFMTFPILFGTMSIIQDVLPLFLGNQFLKSIILIKILLLLLVFIGWNNVLGIQGMIPLKREKEFTCIVAIGAISNFVLNLILIPKYGGVGAAISSIFAEGLIMAIEFYILRKIVDFIDVFKTIYKYLFASIGIFSMIFLVNKVLIVENTLLKIILNILIGITTYIVLLLVLRDDILRGVLNKIRRK